MTITRILHLGSVTSESKGNTVFDNQIAQVKHVLVGSTEPLKLMAKLIQNIPENCGSDETIPNFPPKGTMQSSIELILEVL
jgi:hypothetical protein